jgi:hypothetical protein
LIYMLLADFCAVLSDEHRAAFKSSFEQE